MRVITRQLAKEILFSSGFVLIALVALFAFFDLVGQLDDVLLHEEPYISDYI